MFDKLKTISPILVVVLLVSQGYLAWAANEARVQAKAANWQAMQATNASNRAYTSSANASAKLQQVQNSVSAHSLSRKPCSSGPLLRAFYTQQTYTIAYHEFLLEDLARRSKLDLKSIRRDFQRLARKMGHAKPRGWKWARKAD